MSATAEKVQHPYAAAKAAGREPFKVADLSLADFGRKELRLAEQELTWKKVPGFRGLEKLVVLT